MIDRETELLERWSRERELYSAWGNHIAVTLSGLISAEIEPVEIGYFLKVPMVPRVKDAPSLLAKAFYRGKNYSDPYEEIEDKVGLRAVVLFSENIRLIENCITGYAEWIASKARDFEEERLQRPFEFDYQSVHYVLRNRQDVDVDGIVVPSGTPCEVQIRTILQHAYSELTHDTIYKPNITAQPEVKRAAAKSMALMEATDDYFTEVQKWLQQAQAPGEAVRAIVEKLYNDFLQISPENSPLNSLIIDHFGKWAREEFEDELRTFLDQKPFISDRIKERSADQLLYRQAGILLVYWCVSVAPNSAGIDGPLSNTELEYIYSDLGLRMPS